MKRQIRFWRRESDAVTLTILGICYSMKNSKVATKHGRFSVKHPKAQQFEKDFMVQVPAELRRLDLVGPLRAIVTVYYPSRRQDLDCAIVYDLLQKSGVIHNDRDIIERHEFRETDRQNPRVEITVEAL